MNGTKEKGKVRWPVMSVTIILFALMLVAIVVNAYSAATSITSHNSTLITIVPVFFNAFMSFSSPWLNYVF